MQINNQNKIGLGIILEKWLYAMLSGIYKAKDGYKIKHVDWNKYNYGKGVDLKVSEQNKPLIDLEAKHWRDYNRPYGTEIIISEIIDRFKDSTAKIKIAAITFKSLIPKEGLKRLKKENIHLFEIGRLIGKNDFKTKFFYETKAKLASFINSIKTSTETPFFSINKLSNYLVSNTSLSISSIIAHRHDTQLQVNPMVAYVFSLLRPVEQPQSYRWKEVLRHV